MHSTIKPELGVGVDEPARPTWAFRKQTAAPAELTETDDPPDTEPRAVQSTVSPSLLALGKAHFWLHAGSVQGAHVTVNSLVEVPRALHEHTTVRVPANATATPVRRHDPTRRRSASTTMAAPVKAVALLTDVVWRLNAHRVRNARRAVHSDSGTSAPVSTIDATRQP
jgi:hypothetical protein